MRGRGFPAKVDRVAGRSAHWPRSLFRHLINSSNLDNMKQRPSSFIQSKPHPNFLSGSREPGQRTSKLLNLQLVLWTGCLPMTFINSPLRVVVSTTTSILRCGFLCMKALVWGLS
jgi:hypothetical protein